MGIDVGFVEDGGKAGMVKGWRENFRFGRLLDRCPETLGF